MLCKLQKIDRLTPSLSLFEKVTDYETDFMNLNFNNDF